MHQIKILIFIFTASLLALAQTHIRQSNESAEQFIQRIKPDSFDINHTVIETNVWEEFPNSIIVLYIKQMPYDHIHHTVYDSLWNNGYFENHGRLYILLDDSSYYGIPFKSYGGEGGPPDVLAVFFANADDDKEKELIILTKEYIRHYDATGDAYYVEIYDDPKEGTSSLSYIDEELNSDLSGCDCYSQEGHSWETKYRNASDIKKRLKELGF